MSEIGQRGQRSSRLLHSFVCIISFLFFSLVAISFAGIFCSLWMYFEEKSDLNVVVSWDLELAVQLLPYAKADTFFCWFTSSFE